MKIIIATIVALLLATVANAGPFGYAMGQKIEGEPDGTAVSGHSVSIRDNAPKPFGRLELFHTPKAGLCRVHAIGADVERSHYRGLISLLTDEYGEPSFDTADSTTWRNPPNDDNIYSIHLRIMDLDDSSHLRLHYTFTNHRDCRKEVLTAEKRAIEDGLRDLL